MFDKVTIKDSSFIKGCNYINGELELIFKSGIYKYNVAKENFIEFLFSNSKGSYYNKHIKHIK